jgi:hypothetical protein
MKKIVSLILALALIVCLPCAASAAANSPGNDAPVTGDSTMVGLWLLIMVCAMVAIVVTAVVYHQNAKKNMD